MLFLCSGAAEAANNDGELRLRAKALRAIDAANRPPQPSVAKQPTKRAAIRYSLVLLMNNVFPSTAN